MQETGTASRASCNGLPTGRKPFCVFPLVSVIGHKLGEEQFRSVRKISRACA